MRLALLLAALVMLAGAAFAQSAEDRVREREITAAAAALDALTRDLRDNGVRDPEAFETELRALIAASRGRLAPTEEALKRAEERLALLGPAPKEGEPAEAASVAREREASNNEIVSLRGQRTRIIANIDAATALLDEYSAQRLSERYGRLLKREAPLISPGLWSDAAREGGVLAGSVQEYFADWRAGKDGERDFLLVLLALIGAIILSFLMIGPVSGWLRTAFSERIQAHTPTPARRVAVAGVKMLTRLIPGIAGGFLVIGTSRAFGLIGEQAAPVAHALWRALIAYLIVDGFARGLFAPNAPTWRLADIESARTRYAFGLLVWIVIIVGAGDVFGTIVPDHAAALAAVIDGATSIIVGALVFALSRRAVWVKPAPAPDDRAGAAVAEETAQTADAEEAPLPGGPWSLLRVACRVLALAMIIAPIAGYGALGVFAATRLYYLTIVLTILWFVRAALKEMTIWADQKLRAERDGGVEADDKQAFRFWIGAGIDIILFLLLTPALFIIAGVNASIVRDYILRAFVGFRVGDTTISLVSIFVAIGVFVGILALTRLFQNAMKRGPFAHSRIDPGIQNSLTTLFGYVGLVIAAVVGLGMLGVDLSNLALIAGALSVGVGFGLQSIVNNFVSGIILLFERPVRAGDWIVTPSGEGIVKKISVRSTVLETWDRSSVIIPNSELIASSVTNWTHKSALGRIRVPVGVSYGGNPEQVREVLLRCADAHPLIVRYPEPFVVWDDFGASSLDFELRAYIADIFKGLQVRTDLRFAIFKAFREEGIEFPFPAQDVFIRSLPEGGAEKLAPLLRKQQPAHPPAPPDDKFDAPDD